MYVHELKPPKGSKQSRKRVGCGPGSGLGKTSGRGHKGQKSRSGGGVRPGFEGGQTPIYRRLPRRGFNNKNFAVKYEIVNVGSLSCFPANSTVTRAELIQAGLIAGRRSAKVKILGEGDLNVALILVADKWSTSAEEKIKAAGGTVAVPSAPPADDKPVPAEDQLPRAETRSESPEQA